MNTDDDPELEVSAHSGEVIWRGETVDLHIYRIAGESNGWSLEVVNAEMTSTVWNELFETDTAALEAFWECIRDEGIETFTEAGTRH